MQSATPTFPSPPAQNGYQPLSEAEIYAIKRQYLGLLPPQQIIDICLTFEAHAPLHVKGSVWPYDIRAAIASIQAQKAQATQAQTPPESDVPSRNSDLDVATSSTEKTVQPQASSSDQTTPVPTPAEPSSGPQPAASQSTIPPTTPGPHYPHHPYYHPGYPHASYYPPHGAYGYSHPYPYPQPPAMYPANPTSHNPPLFTNTPLVHPPHPAPEPPPSLGSVDDLPSYEEMIVEALLDSGDPEGCAPKSLFSWMATHYPLQTNFRPSASQALQKAYKRGRLEKGSNGKYRLNENWEGGNTSRRTTRRPQTLAQTTFPGPQPPSSSPFTHTPLASHGARPPPPGQPPGYGGYSFTYPLQGTSGSVPSARHTGTASQKQTADAVDHETGEGSDAWEAAQNILKAINFGQLFQISNGEHKGGEPSTPGGSHDRQTDKSSMACGTAILQEPAHDISSKPTELDAEQRAALQAQFALLAAQLAELADVTEEELSHNLEVSQSTISTSEARTPQVLDAGPGQSDDDDDDNEDMEEVAVPMASLTS